MIDKDLQEQLKSIFSNLEGNYELVARVVANHPSGGELLNLLKGVTESSDHLKLVVEDGDGLELFIRNGKGEASPFIFYAVPNGHEFSSLILAILNFDGKGKNLPDEFIRRKIESIKGVHTVRTYISLTCTNCPQVVQALNVISIINPNITHKIVDGAINREEVEALHLQGVPAVFVEDKMICAGKASLGKLIDLLEREFGTLDENCTSEVKLFDALVLGAGPAGSTAAIYLARKGLKVGVIADKIGGQVTETVGIENFISVPYTTGKELANNMQKHLESYPINIFLNRMADKIEAGDGRHSIETKSGEKFAAPTIIIATGAKWRKLNIPGEDEYVGKGVAYCPHCDGPFYAGMDVAVVGGGNSGMEAAIDLSRICHKVILIEFMDTLKADKVLQEKALETGNIEIYTNTQSLEVIGDGTKVIGLKVLDRTTREERVMDLSAVFVQIGLSASSDPFKGVLDTTHIGEIIIDNRCRTSVKGIYAAGDVSSVPFKQIVIAIGEGAKAALSAYEDKMTCKT